MTELEMFAKLPQLNRNKEKDREGGYLPILIKNIGGDYTLSYDSCYVDDTIFEITAGTPEEAIKEAYEGCISAHLI